MRIRAVICDIYKTLLAVEPPLTDAPQRWITLWRQYGQEKPLISLAEFSNCCRKEIALAHAQSQARGIAFPEVFWPDIVRQALPELAHWPETMLDSFLFEHAQLERTVRLMPGAVETLQAIVKRNLRLGLCSNCQPYTLHELTKAFAGSGLSLAWFDPQLRFFSYVAGFSKPNPEAFRQMRNALNMLGISPSETLMVGDRLDNDIQPAQAHGWQTWQLTTSVMSAPAIGTWSQLYDWLLSTKAGTFRWI